jgi:hypothetical protein
VKSRRTPIEWFEGIAVIQELCRTLLESGAGGNELSFGPEDVFLESAGSVRAHLHEGSEDESVVRQVGELLHLVLEDSSFPVPLRLVITQATSVPPFYPSIAELSAALEYFERPDRLGLVRAVYERAQTLPAVAEAAAPVEQEKPAPTRKKTAAESTPGRGPLPRGLIYGVAAVVLTGAVGAGVAAWFSPGRQNVAPISTLEKEDPKGADAGKPAARPGRVDPANLPGPGRQIGNGTGGAAGFTARSSHPLLQIAPRATTERSPSMQSAPPSKPEAQVPPTFAAYDVPAASDLDGTIYSARDSDVTPPIATYPRLPAEPPSGVRAEAFSTLELLVTETGAVESVKLRGRPSHLAEALLATMNLSAAKTWRFVPALKDGRPVKYRTLIRVWLAAP